MKQPVDFKQYDARWADNDYSVPGEKTNIRESGCGPTSAAMIVATLADRNENPAKACQWALKNGYKALKQGTYYSFFPPYFQRFGLKCTQLNWKRMDKESVDYGKPYHQQVIDALGNGAYVIACMGPGLWTKSGHFVVLYAVTNGTVYINDPASVKPERLQGDWNRFKKEVKYYFVIKQNAPDKPIGGDDMTQEQFNQMMDKYLAERSKLPGSEWSKADREWAVKNGIFQGDGTGAMQWQGLLTRESAAVILHRLKG